MILAVAIVVVSTNTVLGTALLARGLTSPVFVQSLISLAANIALLAILGSLLGALGAALAMLGCELLRTRSTGPGVRTRAARPARSPTHRPDTGRDNAAGAAVVSAICRRLWSVVRPRTVGRAARYLVLAIRFRQLRRRFLAVGRCCEVSIHRSARVTFGRRVRFLRFTTLHVHAGADLRIDDGVSFSPGCTVCVHERLEIGEGSTFGEGVSIHDEDHLRGPFDVPLSRRGFATAPIAIGRNVWIGAKATVLKGVTIGDDAVIGAGAVVTRDVPARAVAVGVPARVIGRGSVAAVPGEAA